jgi:hypothetical protein
VYAVRICEAKFGAVEDIEWRDFNRTGPAAADDGLRFSRLATMYKSMVDLLNPAKETSLRGAFYVKNVCAACCHHPPMLSCPLHQLT